MSRAGIGNDFISNLLGGFGFGQQAPQGLPSNFGAPTPVAGSGREVSAMTPERRARSMAFQQRQQRLPQVRQDFMGARDFSGQLAQGEANFGNDFGLNNLGMQAQQRQQMMQMMAQRFNNPATRLANRPSFTPQRRQTGTSLTGRPIFATGSAAGPTDQQRSEAANRGISIDEFMSLKRFAPPGSQQGQPTTMLGSRRGPGMIGLMNQSEMPGFAPFPGEQQGQQQMDPFMQFLQTQMSNQQNQQQQFNQSPLGQSITNNAAGQGGRFFQGRRIG